jgi:uncharacterized protein (TIGR02594 family)
MNPNKLILLKAAGELGVKETPGTKDNPRVVEYQKYSTVKNLFGWADSVPWCSTFQNWVDEHCGLVSTNSASARSYLKWGYSTKADPLPGDRAVFWRGKNINVGTGHVTILLKRVGNLLYCLGGNQSDMVNISTYGMDRLMDFRRYVPDPYTEFERAELHKIADDIMAGEKLLTGGKVV